MRKVHLKSRLNISAAAGLVAGAIASSALAAPVVDGTLDGGLYTRFATQTIGTGFGDNASELDAGYFRIDSGKLFVFLAGNLESNNNKLALFFDTRAGGQNVVRNDNPDIDFNALSGKYAGLTFDAAFSPDYFLALNRENNGNDQANSQFYANFSELNTGGGGNGGYLGSFTLPTNVPSVNQQGAGTVGGGSLPSVMIGYNDSNTLGVDGTNNAADQAAAQAVSTGTEFSIDLAALGIEGDFKLGAFINGDSSNYLSNQALGGFAPGTGNLGADGTGGGGNGTLAGINLNNFSGDQFVSIPVTLPTFTYNVDADGSYSNAANFTGNTVPTGANGRVVFGPVITAPRTVTIDLDVSLVSLTFDSANAYTLAGANTITVNGNAATPAVRVLQGSHIIGAPLALANTTRFDVAAGASLAVTGTLNAAGRDVFKQGAGTLALPATAVNSLSVNGGTLRLNGSGNTTLRGVTVDGGTTLDLTNTALVLNYDDGFSPLATVKGYAASGALTSSTKTGAAYAIGYVDSAANPALVSFGDTPLDATTLVFAATLKGDTNLSKMVDFDDLLALAQNYDAAGSGKEWYQGDSNYDGKVDFDDLLSLAQNYGGTALADGSVAMNASLAASFAADWALAQSLVPEPTSLAAIAGLAGLTLRRRRVG